MVKKDDERNRKLIPEEYEEFFERFNNYKVSVAKFFLSSTEQEIAQWFKNFLSENKPLNLDFGNDSIALHLSQLIDFYSRIDDSGWQLKFLELKENVFQGLVIALQKWDVSSDNDETLQELAYFAACQRISAVVPEFIRIIRLLKTSPDRQETLGIIIHYLGGFRDELPELVVEAFQEFMTDPNLEMFTDNFVIVLTQLHPDDKIFYINRMLELFKEKYHSQWRMNFILSKIFRTIHEINSMETDLNADKYSEDATETLRSFLNNPKFMGFYERRSH